MTREQKEQIDRINELTLNLCNDAYNKGFEAGTKTMQECSWEKGVRDAWEYITKKADEIADGSELFETGAEIFTLVKMLHDLDPVIYTKDYVDSRNKEELAKTEPIEVGDVVIDADGKERVVIHITESEFAYALNIKDSSDLLVEILYSLKKTGKKAVVKVFKPLAVGELK